MVSEVGEIRADFVDAAKKFQGVVTESKQKIPKDKMEFFLSQIERINQKLNSFEKTVEIGLPLAEAESSMSRLSNLERQISELSSKMNLIITNTKGLGKEVDAIEEELKGGISSKAIEALNTRLDYLEGLLKQYSGSKTKKILEDLVEIVQNLEKEINNIENFIEKDLQAYIKIEEEPVEKKAKRLQVEGQGETQEQLAEKQKSWWDKIKEFFGF